MGKDKKSKEHQSEEVLPQPEYSAESGGSNQPTSLNVQVNTERVNVHPSSIDAIEKLSRRNPSVATQLIEASNSAVIFDFKKYKIGAICAAVIAVSIIFSSALIIAQNGFWAGIAFFLCCAAVSAIVGSVFTGKTQDLSWTVGFMGTKQKEQDKDDTAIA